MYSVENELGIYIPTYKRPNLLRKALESIITSIRFSGASAIPIFITDDSEDNETMLMIEEFKNVYPYIAYKKNATRLGLDRNIVEVLFFGDTAYKWILGNDDLLYKHSVGYVLNILDKIKKRRDIPVVFVNYSYVDNDYKYILKERVVDLSRDIIVSAKDFIRNYIWAAGFIGSTILNSSCLEDEMVKYKYCGNFYPHIGIIMDCIKDKNVFMIAEPLVLNRAENSKSFTWTDKAFEVFHGFENTLRMFENKYGSKLIEQSLKESEVLFKHKSLLWIASKRADGVLNLSTWNEYIRNSSSYTSSQKFFSFLIASFPKIIFSFLKYMTKTLPQRIKRKPLKL